MGSAKLTSIFFTACMFLLLTSTSAVAGTLEVGLQPTGLPCNSSICYLGRDGLFLGSNYQTQYNKPANNFTFLDDVKLSIDSVTGNAQVQGTISNNANPDDLWSMSMSLSGFGLKDRNNGQFFDGTDPYDEMVEDLLAIPLPYTQQQYGKNGYGIEWQNANLTITSLHATATSAYGGPTSFVGWDGTYDYSAALHNWNGQLYFAAWFGQIGNPSKNLGDSKAFGAYIPGTTPIPEPATVLLLGAGFLGAMSRRRKLSA